MAEDQPQLEFYWDILSSPSRCVAMTLKALDASYVDRRIKLLKGESKTAEFLRMNPLGRVPTIRHGDFCLTESKAIARYLCDKLQTPTSTRLYPRDVDARARVDEMLSLSVDVKAWIYAYTNIHGILFRGETGPIASNLPQAEKALVTCSRILSKTKFIAGDHLTIADFYMATAFIMLDVATDDDFRTEFYAKDETGNVMTWMSEIRALPYFDDVNAEGTNAFRDWCLRCLKEVDAK